MNKSKVIKMTDDSLWFSCGTILTSDHERD